MLKKAILFLLILLSVLYLRHLWFVNINAFLSGGGQQFMLEDVGVLQGFFASISWLNTLEKLSHFFFFASNVLLTQWFLRKLFTIPLNTVLLFSGVLVALFMLGLASFLVFRDVDFVVSYSKWMVVRLQSPLVFMLGFVVFYLLEG